MDVLIASNLESSPKLRHGFFTKAWGNAGLSDVAEREDVTQNRQRMALKLGVKPDHLLTCYQVHSPDVATVTKIWAPDDRPRADAMVTKEKNIALGILTADCVPILFADVNMGVIGAAHAGWRGAISGVIEHTLEAMEALGARRKSILAALGPCIWQRSYEVGPEFPAPFLAENPENERFFRPAFKSDHTLFDLPGYIEAKLRSLGLVSIESSPADTCADEARFFSHRSSTLKNEKRGGNLISAIVLTE